MDTAESLLEWEVNLKAIAVNHAIQTTLNQNQFNALVSFAYNARDTGFIKFYIIKKSECRSSRHIHKDAFMMWDKAHVDGKRGCCKRPNQQEERGS